MVLLSNSSDSLFHFLRPAWLLLFIPIILIGWQCLRQDDPRTSYRGEIASHLLSHLIVAAKNRPRFRPLHLMLIIWCLGTIALAGPSWRREASPFGEETSGLMILVKVTPSMEATDLPPSRLERARLKVQELLLLREGSPTGLVAYSGSAHMVMPMTSDSGIINHMLEALEAGVLPEDGDRLDQALNLAREAIENKSGGGSILILADSIADYQLDALATIRKSRGPSIQILSCNATPGSLNSGAQALGATLHVMSADNSDIESIQNRAESALAFSSGDDDRWRDDGFLLMPLLALGLLFWGRRGWAVTE